MKLERGTTRIWIKSAQAFLEQFAWLTDSYVLDFYCDNHWEKLPLSWREFLLQLQPEELGIWLDTQSNYQTRNTVAPLSLLSFKAAVKLLSMKRSSSDAILEEEVLKLKKENNVSLIGDNPNPEFTNLFNRHVKLKKRHEIQSISNIIGVLCAATKTENILDIGAGIGHLSRFLSYGCGFQLTCVDCVENFGSSASKFDNELESFIAKKNGKREGITPTPTHKCLKLEMDTHDKYLHKLEANFGIIGLHTCGNLAPLILHNFVNSPAKFFLSVGCCYMKLDSKGFPLSNFCKECKVHVSYEGLEVACHAIEQYCKRLKDGFASKLMVHCYRATLETILVSRFGIRKAGLKSVKSEKLSFPEYAINAVKSIGVLLTDEDLQNEHVSKMLKNWYQVVLFFSLRLLCANVIETIVLLDRGLFVIESCPDLNVHILPVFDPNISPRNFALFGTRTT